MTCDYDISLEEVDSFLSLMEPLGVCAPNADEEIAWEAQRKKYESRTQGRREQRNKSHFPTWYRVKQRHVSPAQKNALLTLMPKYGLITNYFAGKFDFPAIFQRMAPVVLDIGFGMADSILGMAQYFPDKDYVGVEIMKAGVGAALKGIDIKGLNNTRVVGGDVLKVIRNNIPDCSLSEVCVFFPDPWVKWGDSDRRLLRPATIELIAQKMLPGALLHVATDSLDYRDHVMDLFAQEATRKHWSSFNRLDNPVVTRPEWRPSTRYEVKSIDEGRAVWDMCFVYAN